MILRIDSCGECPALDGSFGSYDNTEYLLDCKLSRKKSRTAEKNLIPAWCPLRKHEVKGLPDYIEKEQRVIAMIPDELKELMDKPDCEVNGDL